MRGSYVKLLATNLHLGYDGHMAKQSLPIRGGFKNVLRKSGLKATPARLLILALMKKSRHPLSAQEIIEELGRNFDEATIYRILKNLKSRGIIKQIDLRHNHAHYELVSLEDHHHLICMQCGKIEDITGCEVEDMYHTILAASKEFRDIRQHSLEFYGTCASCGKRGVRPKEQLFP